MNINREQTDDLNVAVSVEISRDDYEPKVGEVLRDYRRKANIPGFRPGKAPEGMIRKMYGKAVLVDEINKLVAESLQKYINDQQWHILGNPMPKQSDELDWEIGNDFSFGFEMGLAPAVEVNLTGEDHLTRYQIILDQDTIDRDVDGYAARYGKFVEAGAITDFMEKLTGNIIQLNGDGQPLPDGMAAEDTSILLSLIKTRELKQPFENAKVGDHIIFNLTDTFPNEWEIASILKKQDTTEISKIGTSLFRFTVTSIQKFVNAEVNQELFDKVFGKGTVTSREGFENRIREAIMRNYEDGCMNKFIGDAREYYIKKIDPKLPEEFLHKWLKSANSNADGQAFENDFPLYMISTKWELIAGEIARQYNLTVSEKELLDIAKKTARTQFAMYGLNLVSDDSVIPYAANMINDEKTARELATQALDRKIAQVILETADVNVQEIDVDAFNKIYYGFDNNISITGGNTGTLTKISEETAPLGVPAAVKEPADAKTADAVAETAEEPAAEEIAAVAKPKKTRRAAPKKQKTDE